MTSIATPTSPTPACVPGCDRDHSIDGALGFAMCDAPVAVLPAGAGQLVVSASRVLEDGVDPFTAVAFGVDNREPLELDPATARRVAAAIVRAADLAEQAA